MFRKLIDRHILNFGTDKKRILVNVSDNAISSTINSENFNTGLKELKDGMKSTLIEVENNDQVDGAILIELI